MKLRNIAFNIMEFWSHLTFNVAYVKRLNASLTLLSSTIWGIRELAIYVSILLRCTRAIYTFECTRNYWMKIIYAVAITFTDLVGSWTDYPVLTHLYPVHALIVTAWLYYNWSSNITTTPTRSGAQRHRHCWSDCTPITRNGTRQVNYSRSPVNVANFIPTHLQIRDAQSDCLV